MSTNPPIVEHVAMYQRRGLRTGRSVWQAHCSCGWRGARQVETLRDAHTLYATKHGIDGQLGADFGATT